MKKEKTLMGPFRWIPMDQRTDPLGFPLPPHPPEPRRPWLWLVCRAGEDQRVDDIFLVNNSGEALDLVTADTAGVQTVDDDIMMVSHGEGYRYENVSDDSAVKVDDYHMFYDSDFLLQIAVQVKSKKLGSLEILCPITKGGIGETVLIWNTGEPARGVSIKKAV